MTSEFGKKLWRLYDSGQKSFYNNLNFMQIAKIVSSIPAENIANWFVCEDGNPDWAALSERRSEFTQVDVREEITKSLVGLINESATTGASATNFDSLVGELQRSDKRQMGRIKTNIPALIDVGQRILSCNVSDISILGLKLDHEFPNSYRGAYHSVILKTPAIINLRCLPLINELEVQKGTWSRMSIHPQHGLSQLADFLAMFAI